MIINKTETFLATKRIRIGKYFFSVGLIIGGYIISPIWAKGLDHSIIVWKSMFKDVFNILMTIFFPIIAQLYTNITIRNHIKKLTLDNDVMHLMLFGVFSNKLKEIKYEDISSINYTADDDKNFILKMKNGEEKIIYAQISNKEEAFSVIKNKINRT